jgi:integrase
MPERSAITCRADGRYVGTVQLHGKRKFVYGRSEREVKQKLSALLDQTRTTGSVPTPGKRSLNDLLDAWLDAVRNVLKPRTVLNYELTAERYIRPILGHIRLSRLEPTAIQALYSRLSAKGLSHVPAYTHGVLHRACRLGVLWGWLGQNPCDRLILPRYRPARKGVWTAEQTAAFLQTCLSYRYGPLWTFLVFTGARIGEATALQWSDVTDSTVTIRRAAHRIRGQWVITDPKTQAGVRTISLSDSLRMAFRAERARQAQRRLSLGAKWQDEGLVFGNDTGGVLHPSMVAHAVQKACDEQGLPRLTPHQFRHLSASLLLQQGIPLPNISRRLGHANPGITTRIYSHVTQTDHHAADALENLLTGTAPPEVEEETSR